MCGVAIIRPYTGVVGEGYSVCQKCYGKESDEGLSDNERIRGALRYVS